MSKNKIIRRNVFTPTRLQVREKTDGTESRTITGYAILFNVPSVPLWDDDESETREEIAPEAVTKELLDGQDIKMTMFHNRQLILARSDHGTGTLSYSVDDKGVAFEFDAPNTVDGDKALELVRRGDISGCSFAYTTNYYDPEFVEYSAETVDGKVNELYRVKQITGIYDFTLAADPAYPETTVEARELAEELHRERREQKEEDNKRQERIREQVAEMRRAASMR